MIGYFTYFMRSGRRGVSRSRTSKGAVYIPKSCRILPPFIIGLVSASVSEFEMKREIGWWRRKGKYSFFNLMSCFSKDSRGCFFGVSDYYLAGCPSSRVACTQSGEEESKHCEYSWALHCSSRCLEIGEITRGVCG